MCRLTQPRSLKILIIALPDLDSKAQNLSMMSAKYKKDAASLNATSWIAIAAGSGVLFFIFILWKFIL